jgi:LysR family glycine cleavage system transcriptional activator
MALADVEAGEADAAVRIGPGRWGNLLSHRISEVFGTVVASPELAAHAGALSQRGELPMVCLNQLEEHTRRTLSAIGLEAQPNRALRVDNYMGVVQAAERGLGVAVIYTTPAKPFEAGGKLVALSRDPIPAPFAMYFVCRQGEAERPDLIALREWLVDCILA